MAIKIALVGNPNSGKTTLFNTLTGSNQYVGNWPGVTVEKKEGKLKKDKEVSLIDLPGIYSLSPYTLEEVVSRDYLLDESPDAIINIVDATNIERNLYLTTQLLELGTPVIIAINMIDMVKENGKSINSEKISQKMGCPVVKISALKGIGQDELVSLVKKLAEDNTVPTQTPLYSQSLESSLSEINSFVENLVPEKKARWYTIKLFERDYKIIEKVNLSKEALKSVEAIISLSEKAFDDDAESIITNERYDFITDITQEGFDKKKAGELTASDKIDQIVTSPIFALPIFVGVMFLVYYLALSTIGTGMTDWVNDVLFGEVIYGGLSRFFEGNGVNAVVSSLVLDGIVSGVGAVMGFLPQMMVLFLLLAILEDSGYMSRIAFVLDKLFRNFGLSGKSFIPILISTGCGVPGIMATRTIDSERDRRMTAITTTFIPCGAKLPIISLFAGALFQNAWWVAPSAYFIGIIAIIVSGIILKKTKIFSGDAAPFVMELPPYRLPNLRNLVFHMWDKAKAFVKRAGSVIFVSSVIIWFLSNFGWSMQMVESEQSILATIGNVIAPIFIPLGWGDWKSAVATLTGLVAKENVVGTIGVLFGFGELSETGAEMWSSLAGVYTVASGFSFLIFNLLCAPCFAAIGALKSELGTKWMWIAIGYQTGLAYIVAFLINQFGLLMAGGGITIGTVFAFVVVAIILFLLFRPNPNKNKPQIGTKPLV